VVALAACTLAGSGLAAAFEKAVLLEVFFILVVLLIIVTPIRNKLVASSVQISSATPLSMEHAASRKRLLASGVEKPLQRRQNALFSARQIVAAFFQIGKRNPIIFLRWQEQFISIHCAPEC
jgi:phosphate/sulfate permease